MALETIKKRPDFLAVRGGVRASVPVCLLEAKPRKAGASAATGARFGLTITKKLGSAVTRNRIRRRLKAALTEIQGDCAVAGFDYVLLARAAAFDRPYGDLVGDLKRAFATVHKPGGPDRGGKSGKPHKNRRAPGET